MGSREKGYTQEQQQAIDEERVRIARDLHDGTLQTITHISHKLEFIQRLLEKQAGDRAIDELQKVRSILAACLHTLRLDISSFMQPSLNRPDITNALFNLVNDFKMSEPTIKLITTFEALDSLPPIYDEPLLRFVQETLNNVRKHAHATEVRLSVLFSSIQLVAKACDDGRGIQPPLDDMDHMGLRILRERVQEVGGTVTIQSASGEGTCVQAVFPLAMQ